LAKGLEIGEDLRAAAIGKISLLEKTETNMKAPESLETLVDYGIIQEVIRPLMSGKEAQVFVVVAGGEECVAKVYKEANARTFKHRSDYTEGRRTRNTRDQRAMNKRSQHGRKKDEDAWRSTEVDMIYRLRDAGVRVPEPINFVEGVLVMELVKDAEGQAAPRLGDLTFSPREAREIYQKLIREVVRMLCAGVIHGDLSDFNVLMSADGPVVIDFPQSVDPTQNPNGEKLLLRDVENLHRFLVRFAPDEVVRPYGQEIWSLFQKNKLTPELKLTGLHRVPVGKADTREVMELIKDADRDEEKRRGLRESDEDEDFETVAEAYREHARPTPFRKVVDFSAERKPQPASKARALKTRRARLAKSPRNAPEGSGPKKAGAADSATKGARPPSNGRRRRRGRRGQSRGEDKAESKPGDVKVAGKVPGKGGRGKVREARVDGEGAVSTRSVRQRRRRRRPSKVSTPE
jgi:RIO kinase 1